jgi:tetratricopeptide (TPR) repeat protein
MFQKTLFRGAFGLAVLLFGFFAICQPLTTFAQSDENLTKLKKRAAELTDQQKFTEALPILQQLVIAEPDNPETNFYLGFACLAQSHLAKDEEPRKAWRIRARNAFLKAKEFGIGVQEPVIDALIQSLPPDGSEGAPITQHAEAMNLMREAEASFSRGKLDDALGKYKKALLLDPKMYEAALFAGDVYTQRGDFNQAEIWYQKAIAIDPTRETAYRYSATPLMRQGKHNQARDRYIEAYISEPYSKFSAAGLTQWAQATNTALGHPVIDVPIKETVEENSDPKFDLSAEAQIGDKADGSFAWISYGATRLMWRREKFAKTFPDEKNYRHSLAEEAEALRSVIVQATNDAKVKSLSSSLAMLKRLNDDGLLEAYVLLARPDEGIAQDHAAYLKHNRDKLRRYTVEYILRGAGSASNNETVGAKKSFKHQERIESEYDKSKDETKVRLQMTPLTCVKDACVFFSLESSFSGSKPPAVVDRFVLALYFFTKTLMPFKDSTLKAFIDGDVIELGRMTFAGQLSKDDLTGLGYGIVLDDAALARLSKANRLEMRLGGIQFSLGEDKVNAIADLYSRVAVKN